mmetsp:Transcript_19798/g.59995  ORF Transcript_19798/g.59995 Transcript_19798/m.59995 type:complete len:318 (+) Transcript_19798:195-1148(+)
MGLLRTVGLVLATLAQLPLRAEPVSTHGLFGARAAVGPPVLRLQASSSPALDEPPPSVAAAGVAAAGLTVTPATLLDVPRIAVLVAGELNEGKRKDFWQRLSTLPLVVAGLLSRIAVAGVALQDHVVFCAWRESGDLAGIAEVSLQPLDCRCAAAIATPTRFKAQGTGRWPLPLVPYISNVCVDRKFRRRGVAATLMSHCEDHVRAAYGGASATAGVAINTDLVHLHVESDNEAALGLYSGLGYAPLTRARISRALKHKLMGGHPSATWEATRREQTDLWNQHLEWVELRNKVEPGRTFYLHLWKAVRRREAIATSA